MEQETILYYHPLPLQQGSADNKTAAKKRWFQEAVLHTKPLTEQEEFCVLGCAVPPFYYRKKAWKAQVLFEAMEAPLHRTAGMTDTCVHPDVLQLLGPEMWERWQPRVRTVKMLAKFLLEQQAKKAHVQTDMVTVLLGQPRETGQQLETVWELLEPYLPRVNRMLIYYEEQEWQRNVEEAGPADSEGDGTEELQAYLEDYYYEYGLMPQLVRYKRSDSAALRCGKEMCGGVILDFGDGFRYPKIASADCVYIDITSDGGKERLLGRKSPAIAYISPLKYLDTLVKNSYDRKVKMT